MKLVPRFMKFADEQQLNKEDIFTQKDEGYTLISFGEEGETDVVYNVMLILYDDNNVAEIIIRKVINTSDMFDVLKRGNELNFDYRGLTYFATEGIISVKTHVEAHGDIEVVLKQMLQTMRVASEEFSKFN